MKLEGKTALVTGSSGALGSSIVKYLLDAGAKVVGIDIAENTFSHTNLTSIIGDVTNAAVLEQTLTKLSPVDILVNNAGILHSAPLANIINKDSDRFAKAANDWKRVLDTNLSSAFYVTQLIADQMVRNRTHGIIINMSSVSARGTAGQSAYAASKAGIEALTRVWVKELGPMGIRCVAIAPGYIDTPSTRAAVSESQLENIAGKVPLKRLGHTEDILHAIRYAIENNYVNGTILEVDGGLVV